MSDPFLGEIKIMGFGFPPRGYAQCNGQILSISQNQALFALLGTTYGGNGSTTFALPDLRGRTGVHRGTQVSRGQQVGAESVTLTEAQLPRHSHRLAVGTDFANSAVPGGALTAARPRGGPLLHAAPGATTSMEPTMVTSAGAGAAHPNMQPYATLNFVIALQGIFPSRN